MDIQKFIEKNLKEAEEEKQNTLQNIAEEQKSLKEIKSTIENDPNLPDSTGVLENLENSIGKDVVIELRNNETVKQKLDYDPKIEMITINGGWGTGLLGDSLLKISDAETGKVIFENKYKDLPFEMRVALLFGKKRGLKSVEFEEKRLENSKEYAESELKQKQEALKNIPTYIERGQKIIYPERHDKWTECVCYRVSDLYHGLELVNAIEVMEGLEKGLSLNEVEKIISDSHSGNSFGMLVNIVTNFSKRGPEFCRAFSLGYKYTLEHGSQAEIKDWQDWLTKLEKENKEYAAKHNGENPPQPND